MANDQTVTPVIIKRKKIIAANGHHGGAWKVAYADFVTAKCACLQFPKTNRGRVGQWYCNVNFRKW